MTQIFAVRPANTTQVANREPMPEQTIVLPAQRLAPLMEDLNGKTDVRSVLRACAWVLAELDAKISRKSAKIVHAESREDKDAAIEDLAEVTVMRNAVHEVHTLALNTTSPHILFEAINGTTERMSAAA